MSCLEEVPRVKKGKQSALDGEKKTGKAAAATGKGKAAAAAINKVQTEKKKMRKARRTAVGTGKAAAAIDETKTDKAPVGTAKAAADTIQTETCAPPPGKHRIPDDIVWLILAMKREEPMRPEENVYLLPGRSVEEVRRKYEEEAALFKRVYDDFEPLQAMVRKEWYDNGFVEVDYDFVGGLAKVKDMHKEDWDEWRKHQESLTHIEYADSDDETYAGFYVPYDPEEVLEQFNLGKASKKMIALESN